MEQIIIKKDLVKITDDFILGVILNEVIETAQRFRKEFIDNNWHCPEFFEMNIEKISNDNMLNLSKSSIRRYIKKLEKLGFITIDKLEKKHKYRVNFQVINKELEKLGAEPIEKLKKETTIDKVVQVKEKINSKNLENLKNNYIDEFVDYTQMQLEEKKIAPAKPKQELKKLIASIKDNIDYNIIEVMRQQKNLDDENQQFIKMFDSIYRIILDVMTTESGYIRINKQEKPIDAVKGIFSKIDFSVINEVIWKLKRIDTKVVNFKSYIITTLYNQFLEREFQVQNLIYIHRQYLGIEI
ncbi:DUF6017 domain-containing protein [uncultured Tyzzerella sp.]|uniref:DUF6017 domain-containing protein n=1 Tax=uncultured Tyzzerella sp. TaxID=2321398 RepID=UPI0029422E86|nr:DUF6017 domain-containing protein [uncultured Tyzzerella sp.]